MQLLRELLSLQHEHGWISAEQLAGLARRRNVPLYRLEELVSFYTHFRRVPPPRVSVDVCRDLSCWMAGAPRCTAALHAACQGRSDIEIREVSCLGRCDSAPAVAVNDLPLSPMTLSDISGVLSRIDTLDAETETSRSGVRPRFQVDPYESTAAHYQTVRQWVADRTDALAELVDRLKRAGLRGMGGAGFPTASKLEIVARAAATPRYIICNADESEPGTFKDRVILENLPHLVIEGMVLSALSVGAEQGIIYLRHEYSREGNAVAAALARARQAGILGDDVAGSGRRFDIEVFVSPGGYILGEETALLEALEDRRGEPRNKPPYPGQHGLWGQPTQINNVETLAFIAAIAARGADWWNACGLGGAKGLKFFSVSGDVTHPGVFEVPLGTTIRELIERAGGVRGGRPLKAILPGGASSNFLSPSQVDTPLDFDAIKAAGSMLGSGAVVVIAEGTDLYALATNIVRFFRNESCGKCVPCRLGTQHAVELLEAVERGAMPTTGLGALHALGETMQQTSICGLGQVALQPVLSLLNRFPEAVEQAKQAD